MDQGKQSISLEPGGQFELSGAPLETLHQTCAEVNSHLYQVCAFCMLVLRGTLMKVWFLKKKSEVSSIHLLIIYLMQKDYRELMLIRISR